MLKGLRSFFRKPTFAEQIESVIKENYDPKNVNERIGLALLFHIQKQLDLLGFEVEQVPNEEPYVSKKCCGTLYGLALGILECEHIPPDRDIFIDTVIAAFALVFGHTVGADLAQDTDREIAAMDEEITWAANWSMKDLKGVYDSGAASSWAAFYLAAKKMI